MNAMLIILFIVVFLLFFPITYVRGASMYPAIQHGDILFSARVFNYEKHKCKPGRIYVYRSPDERKRVISRLIGIAEGEYFFEGDNKDDSYDSRHYGLVDPKSVIAEVVGILYRKKS